MNMLPKQLSDIFYPLLIAIGLFLALVCIELFFKRNKLKKGTATDYELAITLSAAFGIVSAVLFQNLYEFIENPITYRFTWGMTFFGGLVGGVFFFFILYFLYLRKHRPGSLIYLLTVAGGAIPLAHAFGRIGCFLAGCCYGKEVQPGSFWYWMGIKFVTTDAKVIPTNLIEAVFLFLLASFLLFLAFKKRTRLTFPLYAIFYGLFRFLIELARGDDRGDFVSGISPSQFWSIVLFGFGVFYLVYLVLKKKTTLPEIEEVTPHK